MSVFMVCPSSMRSLPPFQLDPGLTFRKEVSIVTNKPKVPSFSNMRLTSPRRKKKRSTSENKTKKRDNNISIDKDSSGQTSCEPSFVSTKLSISRPTGRRKAPTSGSSPRSRGSVGLGNFLQSYDSMMDSLSSMSFDSETLFPDGVRQKPPSNRPKHRPRHPPKRGIDRTISTNAVCLQINLPEKIETGRDLGRASSGETMNMHFTRCIDRSSSFSSMEDSFQLARNKSCLKSKKPSLGDLFQAAPRNLAEDQEEPTCTTTHSSSLGDPFQPSSRDFDEWQEISPARGLRRNSSSSLGDLCLTARKPPPRRSSSSLGDLFQAAPRDFDSW